MNGPPCAAAFEERPGTHLAGRALAAKSGAPWRVEGASRVLDANLGRAIGTDAAGNAASGLRVVTDSSGNVITSYPIHFEYPTAKAP